MASAAWRSAGGLEGAAASGVVWYERQGNAVYKIWPAVEVLATGTEHLESACGSASLAVALMHHASVPDGGTDGTGRTGAGHSTSGVRSIDVIQPSGESLRVFSPPATLESAWIAGPVHLVAQGTAYV